MHPQIAWAKLEALSRGTEMAAKMLKAKPTKAKAKAKAAPKKAAKKAKGKKRR